MLRIKIKKKANNKKTAWELIKKIPDTPEQKKIDREIAAIERKYEEMRIKRLNHKEKKPFKTKKAKISTSSKIKENDTGKKRRSVGIYITENYGWNAGKIWNALNKYGPLNQSSIIKDTKLSLNDFYTGIGWLARENKIYKDMRFYKLGDTNLTNKIGEKAGKIWRLIDSQGQVNVSSIVKKTHIKIQDAYSALGWLAREDKIKTDCKNKLIKSQLK